MIYNTFLMPIDVLLCHSYIVLKKHKSYLHYSVLQGTY